MDETRGSSVDGSSVETGGHPSSREYRAPPTSLAENGSAYGYAYGAAMSGLRLARRIAVGVMGTTVVAIGVAMIVLPGPAFVVIPAGLGILGLEFAFARRWLAYLRERAVDLADKVTSKAQSSDPPDRDAGR